MRITVGGVLLTAGAGFFTVMGPVQNLDSTFLKDQIGGFKATISWVIGTFKGSPVETSSIAMPTTAPFPVAVEATANEPVAPPVEPITPVEKTISETPAPSVVAVPPKNRVRRSRRRRRVPKAAGAAPTVTTATARAPKAASNDKLMGTYVTVKLKSGREVKGIYQGKTATQYSIELPGMGPFQYDVANVSSITAAE